MVHGASFHPLLSPSVIPDDFRRALSAVRNVSGHVPNGITYSQAHLCLAGGCRLLANSVQPLKLSNGPCQSDSLSEGNGRWWL
jgi:hypothetical protein